MFKARDSDIMSSGTVMEGSWGFSPHGLKAFQWIRKARCIFIATPMRDR